MVVCGDGSFQMSMNELAAVKCANLDIKILLFQNQVLGMVRQLQNAAPYHGPFGVELDGSPDFQTVAAAYGIPCVRLEDEAHIEGALDEFLGGSGPCLLICKVHPDVGTGD